MARNGADRRAVRVNVSVKSSRRPLTWKACCCLFIHRNVPGVAAYFYTLSEIRYFLAQIGNANLPLPLPLADLSQPPSSSTSALPKLSREGNLLAGAIARTGVGFIMNPVTVLKARYEVSRSWLTLSRRVVY